MPSPATYLKSDPHLTPEAADALDQLVKATYERSVHSQSERGVRGSDVRSVLDPDHEERDLYGVACSVLR